MIKKLILLVLLILGGTIIIAVIKYGPVMRDFLRMETVVIEENRLYLFMGGGSNSGLILDDEKAVLIDTKMGKYSKRLKSSVEEIIGERELMIINTHFHGDHIRGNNLFKANSILAGNYSKEFWILSEGEENLPTDWVSEIQNIDLNDETIEVIPVGKNHTKADLLIYLKDHKTLFTGDVFMHNMHAVIKEESEPDIENWKQTLLEYGSGDLEVDLVVPGHGPTAEKDDLLNYSEYFDDFLNPEFSKRDLKKKYKKWDSLPFMASSTKTFRYMRKLKNQKISS